MKDLLKGSASSEATQSYFKRFPEIQTFNTPSGLQISQAGIGTYRMGQNDDYHTQSLKAALTQGVNLIDTSSNYMNGLSEAMIGDVLADICVRPEYDRSQFVVVSKVGYIQGNLLKEIQENESDSKGYAEIVEMNEGLMHCISPSFIQDQLTRSLDRLGLETLDVLLIHNPEYYLEWASNQEISEFDAHKEYYRRLEAAFITLENEVANGRIKGYGVSSNTFPFSSQDYTFTSLSKILSIVESFPNQHHLSMVQFPMNLLETAAITRENQPSNVSVLELAHQKKLIVLINRPLNAFRGDMFFRLVNYQIEETLTEALVLERIDQLLELAEQFYAEIFPNLYQLEAEKQLLDELFNALSTLKDSIIQIDSFARWKDMMQHFFYPRVDYVVSQLFAESHSENYDLQEWVRQYLQEMEQFFNLASRYFMAKTNMRSGGLLDLIGRTSKEWYVSGSLAATAVRALRSTEGVSCVLVGMRRPEYVSEIINELETPVSVKDRSSTWSILSSF